MAKLDLSEVIERAIKKSQVVAPGLPPYVEAERFIGALRHDGYTLVRLDTDKAKQQLAEEAQSLPCKYCGYSDES